MSQPLTEDEEGKRIVSRDGEVLGTVAKVDQGVAHVDPEGDFETIRSYLNWERPEDDNYTVQETAVEEITDEEVVVAADEESST